MIETHTVRPCQSRVAFPAVGREIRCRVINKLRFGVVFGVAREAVGRQRHECPANVVGMTTFARDLLMRSAQRKTGAQVDFRSIHQREQRRVVTALAVR